MYGLEMARPPASTKALEVGFSYVYTVFIDLQIGHRFGFIPQVKLANQESDLVTLLKRIPLCPAEMKVIREKAELLRDGKLTSRGDALLPLNLCIFSFDALCLPSK